MKTVEQVAKELGLSVHTLNGWRVKGIGPEFCKLGDAVRYTDEAIEAFKRLGKQQSTSQSPQKGRGAPTKKVSSPMMVAKSHGHRPPIDTVAAAVYAGVTEGYLNKLRVTGGGPLFIKRNGLVRYDPGDLDAWLEAGKINSTSQSAPQQRRPQAGRTHTVPKTAPPLVKEASPIPSILLCSFCDKPSSAVVCMVAGPNNIAICDECIGWAAKAVVNKYPLMVRRLIVDVLDGFAAKET